MIVNFRQGIVQYPQSGGVQKFLIPTGNYVSVSTTNGVTDISFAHKTTNYLVTESANVVNAWGPLPTTGIVWLYWDINTLTAAKTYGFTSVQPIVQAVAPTPVEDLHWFDTSTNVMRVYNGTRWQEKIRVFAAMYNIGTSQFISVSALSTQQRFDGTQIGNNNKSNTGRIIVDNTARPITNQSNEFFTTEDDFFVNGSPINTIRLEANILTATPVENVAGYQIVRFSEFDSVELASYHNLQTSAIAIAMQDVNKGEVGAFVVQGIITNPSWNWTTVGKALWVLEEGILVDYDPHTTDNVSYPTGKAPVGRVIGQHSIIFDQGLGGKGDKGDSALANGGVDIATTEDLGKVKLTCEPADPGSPFVVETSDPRMSNAREPLQHIHAAADIAPSAYGALIGGDLQSTLQNIDNAKLNKTGDVMSGVLTLAADPVLPMQAATKQYADMFVPLTQKGTANGVAMLDDMGKIDASQLPQITLTNTFVVSTQDEMLLLDAQTGDLAVRTDIHTTYVLSGTNPTAIGDWQELLTSPDGVVWIDVKPAEGETGIITTGGPITSSGQITISLAGDVAAIENLTGTGIAHRVGDNAWEVKPVELSTGSTTVNGILPMQNGGTGLAEVTGYIKGDGLSYVALAKIPGDDVEGSVPAALTAPWSGITGTPTTLAGYGITDVYSQTDITGLLAGKADKVDTLSGYGILDAYTKDETSALIWSWTSIAGTPTTLAGYGITDAAALLHTHPLDSLSNVDTTGKVNGSILSWDGVQWTPFTITNNVLPTNVSGKVFDDTNTYVVKDANFVIEDDIDVTKTFKFQAGQLTTGTQRVYTMPDASGTFVLTNGLGATGNWNINVIGATTAPWSGITGTPTTLAGYNIGDAYTKTQTAALTWNWSSITSTPTTLAGYGITDVYSKLQVDALTWNWSSITGTPTTLTGYGITDAAAINHTHTGYLTPAVIGTTVASLIDGVIPVSQLPDVISTNTFSAGNEADMLFLDAHKGDLCLRSDLSQTFILTTDDPTILYNWAILPTPIVVTSVDITPPESGITVSGGPITTAGTITLELTDDLLAVENIDTVGYVSRTATNAWSTSPTIPFSNVTGTVPLSQGGTGATSAEIALQNLGGAPLTGTGASGTWNISITGNATSVTNGVYTTSSYADPVWITSLSPSKVVGSWNGSTNINTVAAEVAFADFTKVRNGKVTTNTVTQVVLDSFGATVDSAKYTISAKTVNGAVGIYDVMVTKDSSNVVYITQTGAGNDTSIFDATYNSTTQMVEIKVTPASATQTDYRYSATLFVSA